MVYCIGLTGNIGSGKSTAAKMFKKKGIKVISADDIAKNITKPNQPAFAAIIDYFSHEILNPDQTLNRSILRKIIFTDLQKKLWLEKLLHPLIRKEIANQINSTHSPYIIIEIPLLFDKKAYPYLNRILLVTATANLQVQRLKHRDNSLANEIKTIIKAQPSNKERIKLADDVIKNNGTLIDLSKKVNTLHKFYLKLAK